MLYSDYMYNYFVRLEGGGFESSIWSLKMAATPIHIVKNI
jgi:hypothetical protein